MSAGIPVSEEANDHPLKELQSWWEIPSICQYVSLFSKIYHLPVIEIEELEDGLIEDSAEKPNPWLKDLLLSFLKSIMPGKVNGENWENQLQRLVQRKWPRDKEVPFPEGKSFSELCLRSKVDIIYSLCLYRIDKSDTSELMKSILPDSLRVQKLGSDCAGNTYWYFYGTRLYKEEAPEKKPWKDAWAEQKESSLKKKRGRGRPRKIQPVVNRKSDGESDDFDDGYMNANEKSRWSVACSTMEEWVDFAQKFKDSKEKKEKDLFKIIQEDFLPVLSQIYEEKERKLQQKLKELMPAREKIITRRETRKLRGEIFESPVLNGFVSDEAHRMHLKRDRARRLEERNKRASEGDIQLIPQPKRSKRTYASMCEDFDFEEPVEKNWSQPPPFSFSPTKIKMPVTMDLISEVERLLREVKLHKDAWPFSYPVSDDDVPGYSEIIKEPIDLTTIESKLFEGNYETLEDLNSDFSKMVSNCKLFNGDHHEFSKMADTLWKVFQDGLKKILDSLDSIEEYNDVSDGNPSAVNSNNNDLHYQNVPSIKVSNKPKLKKKKKKIGGMEALEMLAQASELAIQSAQDVNENSGLSDQHQRSSDFPNLKVVPIHNHPQELIERFSSESSNGSTGESNASFESLNHSVSNDNKDAGMSSNVGSLPDKEQGSYINSTFSQLASVIEKSSAQSLNIFSSSDVSDVSPENSSGLCNSRRTSPIAELQNTAAQSSNLGHNLNILNANGNVSPIFSEMIHQPVYNQSNQGISQNNIITTSYIETSPKERRNIRKSPQASISCVGFSGADNPSRVQESVVNESNAGSPDKNITTIDASVIGISSYVQPKQTAPEQSENVNRKQSPVSNITVYPQISSNLQLSPNAEYNISPNSNYCNQTVAVPNASYFDNVNNINNSQTTFVSAVSTNSATDVPLQIPASFANPQSAPKVHVSPINSVPDLPQISSSQQSKIQMETLDNFLRVRMPPGGGQLVVVSEPSPTGVTLHVYSKSKMDQEFVSEHVTVPDKKLQNNVGQNMLNLRGSIPSTLPLTIPVVVPSENPSAKPHAFSNSKELPTENQGNGNRTSPLQKKSPVPVNFQVTPHHVPSKNMPYTTTLTSGHNVSKTSLPITSSNFMPVNSQNVNKNKQFFRNKGFETGHAKMPTENSMAAFNMNTASVSTSYSNNNNSGAQNSSNVYQTVASKDPPMIFSGYNQLSNSQNNIRLKNIPGTAITTQPNLCASSGMPVVQQVLIPARTQQLTVPDGRQIVFATPQNSLNNMFNQQQNVQVQHIQEINQGFAKAMPQLVQPSPIVTLSKDAIQSLQLPIVSQNHSQMYTQGVPSQQFVNIPNYMFTNQNVIQTTSQPVINYQPFQVSQARPAKGNMNT